MKLRNAAERSFVIVAILLLSVLIGYIYSTVWHNIDLRRHPRDYSELVETYAEAYGVPEYLIYGVILTGSEFESNRVSEDGRIGLMQLSTETFARLTRITKENLEPGMLYDPETNVRYGTYWLSYLYTNYGRWHTVLAVHAADDEDLVSLWLESGEYTDDKGNLTEIPDDDIRRTVEAMEEAGGMYHDLYYDTP